MQDGTSNQLSLLKPGCSWMAHNGNDYDFITKSTYYKKCVFGLPTATCPDLDTIRIEQKRGGLLKDAYRWILETDEFKSFRGLDSDQQLFWIHGDRGKRKTMLICGIMMS
jgi:hypothetical protein